MIIRTSDNYLDDILKTVKNKIDKINNKKLYKVCSNKAEAEKAGKRLVSAGKSYELKYLNNDIYVYSVNTQLTDFREASRSGSFTQLAIGRYCFQKNNSIGGFNKYDFDDGSIWKLVTDENGVEYLAKEVEDEDEDKVVRSKTAKLNKKALYIDNTINANNYNLYLPILYLNGNELSNNELLADLTSSEICKDPIFRFLENKFDEYVNTLLQQNNVPEDKKAELVDILNGFILDNSIKDKNSFEQKLQELSSDM